MVSSNGYTYVTISFLSALLFLRAVCPIFVRKDNKLTENNHCITKRIASREIRTNSGSGRPADDVIANLKGHEEEYDALVFACGDAVPVFAQHAGEPWNRDLMEVLKTFGETGKPMIGHCAAGMMFGFAGVAAGRRVAVHPMAKAAVTGPVATDAPFEIDGNFFTAQEEHAIPAMIGRVVEALK